MPYKILRTAVYFVYLLRCSDGSLYCGWTTDLDRRLVAHNAGKGARYARSRRPVELVYFEECGSKSVAMRREWQIKELSRAEKLELVEAFKFDGINTAKTGAALL